MVRTRLRHGVEREVLRCDACSLVFLTPKPAIDYSGEEYRALYSPVVGQKVSPKEIYEMYLPFYRRYRLPTSGRPFGVACAFSRSGATRA